MFTKVGKIIAWVVIIAGASQVVLGFGFASSENSEEAIRRHLGTRTTGEAIDRGIYLFVIGIFMGVLCEISQKLSVKREETTKSDEG